MRAALCILTILTSLGIPAARADARPAAPAPREVPANARPYNGSQISPKHEIGLVDDDGVRMFRHPAYTGGQARNHPVAQAQYGLLLLNTYRLKHDAWFLDRAERQARRMIATRVESRGAWWFPYPFDYPLASGMNYTQQQPWYSAMAQGRRSRCSSGSPRPPGTPPGGPPPTGRSCRCASGSATPGRG